MSAGVQRQESTQGDTKKEEESAKPENVRNEEGILDGCGRSGAGRGIVLDGYRLGKALDFDGGRLFPLPQFHIWGGKKEIEIYKIYNIE